MLWTPNQIGELRAWHEERLIVLRYPQSLKIELRRAREKWIGTLKRTAEGKTGESK